MNVRLSENYVVTDFEHSTRHGFILKCLNKFNKSQYRRQTLCRKTELKSPKLKAGRPNLI